MDRTIHKKMRREARKNDFKKSVTLLKNPVFIFILLFLIINCFLILFQIYWGVITAFKTQSEFRRNLFGLPKEWCWQNFVNRRVYLFHHHLGSALEHRFLLCSFNAFGSVSALLCGVRHSVFQI